MKKLIIFALFMLVFRIPIAAQVNVSTRTVKRLEKFASKDWTAKTWTTKFFAGEDHSGKFLAKRLDIPLEFLLKK